MGFIAGSLLRGILCRKYNNKDDTSGQPDSSGEGPDCSGFVFKTWELKSAFGTSGFQWWNKFQNIHGPYSSTSFHSPVASEPFFKLANKWRSTTIYMDAFAKEGHIAMLYSESAPSSGVDYMIEALGDAPGTGVFLEDFRSDSAYVGVRREAWTPDCWPNCNSPVPPAVAIP